MLNFKYPIDFAFGPRLSINMITNTQSVLLYHNFSGVESRTQGSRPRTQKNLRLRPRTALLRTDPLEAMDRNARGQGQGPTTQAQVFSKKKLFKNFFQAISKREKQNRSLQIFREIFGVFQQNINDLKNSVSSSRGQGNV